MHSYSCNSNNSSFFAASSLVVAGGITVSIIAFVFTIKFLCELAARVVSFLQNEDPGRRGDRSIYDYVRGNYLDPRSCKVSWDWKEPQEVGQTMSFRVQVMVNYCFLVSLTYYQVACACSSVENIWWLES